MELNHNTTVELRWNDMELNHITAVELRWNEMELNHITTGEIDMELIISQQLNWDEMTGN